MNRWLATSCIGLVFLGSCAQKNGAETAAGTTLANQNSSTLESSDSQAKPANPPAASSSNDASKQTSPAAPPPEVVATVNGQPITLEQLQRPVIDAYGLQFLLHLVQLEVCKQKAAALGITVTPEDIAAEQELTLDRVFKDAITVDEKVSPEEQAKFRKAEYDRLLEQLLTNRRISRPEFDLAIQADAYLRKLASRGMETKITEEHLKQGFGIMYGEKVHVRHIQLANMREVAEAQRRLKEGEPFEKVAGEMTADAATRQRGGELRPFSRAEPTWPEAFKDAAFALQEPGEISEPVHAGDSIHLIKLIAKIPPKAVSYEANKEFVREELLKGLLLVRIQQLREAIAAEARSAMTIRDPVLRKQYVDRLERSAGGSGRDPNVVRKEIEADQRQPSATQPTGSSEGQTTVPVPSEGRRPPATMPGR
ncbi:MAG: peptidylprolyl isomerase [Bacillota bacterium]